MFHNFKCLPFYVITLEEEPIRTLGVCFGLMKSDPFLAAAVTSLLTLHPTGSQTGRPVVLHAAPLQTTCGHHLGVTPLPQGHFPRARIKWVGGLFDAF